MSDLGLFFPRDTEKQMSSHNTDSGPKHDSQSAPSAPSHASPDTLLGKYRSPNCKANEKASTLFTFFAHNQHDSSQEFHSFMLSCQDSHFDTPDDVTLKNMKSVSANAMSKNHSKDVSDQDVKVDAHGIALGMQGVKATASEVSKRRMASNCASSGWNLNSVTAHNRFTCRYLGKGLDDRGRMVQNPFQTWKGSLASCDEGLMIGDDVESDIRKLAWEAAGGEEAKLDVNQFLCSITSIPIQ